MEYLVGAMITMIVYVIAHRASQKAVSSEQALTITYSQSHVYELMQPLLKLTPLIEPQEPRQTSEYFKNVYMKCLVVKNKAYWIKDNALYTAEVVEGQVQKETTQKVDTMAMSKVELNEMLFIVEKLREEKDDYRGSGK
jgi:hypothetical protein